MCFGFEWLLLPLQTALELPGIQGATLSSNSCFDLLPSSAGKACAHLLVAKLCLVVWKFLLDSSIEASNQFVAIGLLHCIKRASLLSLDWTYLMTF